MTTEHLHDRSDTLTRISDRVKRPLFLAFFVLSMTGVVLRQFLIFEAGTIGFCLVGLVHLFTRRSRLPLLGNYLGRGRYLRVTREGWIMLALTLAIGLTAMHARVNLLMIVLGMLIGLILISGTLSENSLRRLSVKLFLPSTAFAGVPFPAKLTIRNDKRRLPSYSVRLEIFFDGPGETVVARSCVLKVDAGRTATLEQMLSIDARGPWVVRKVRVATSFPFGFFEKWSDLAVEAEMLVFPAIGRITGRIVPTSREYRPKGRTKVLARIGHDEFWGIREYRDGDNPRLIHWRSSARLGKRLVKDLHREEAQNVCILLDAHVPAGDNDLRRRFESAVSFAATLSRQLIEQDFGVSFAAHGQTLVKLATEHGNRQDRQILAVLAEIRPSPDKDFEAMLNELDPRLTAETCVVAVMLDSARERAARAHPARNWNSRLRVVLVGTPAFSAVFEPPTAEAGP